MPFRSSSSCHKPQRRRAREENSASTEAGARCPAALHKNLPGPSGDAPRLTAGGSERAERQGRAGSSGRAGTEGGWRRAEATRAGCRGRRRVPPAGAGTFRAGALREERGGGGTQRPERPWRRRGRSRARAPAPRRGRSREPRRLTCPWVGPEQGWGCCLELGCGGGAGDGRGALPAPAALGGSRLGRRSRGRNRGLGAVAVLSGQRPETLGGGFKRHGPGEAHD